MKHLVCTALVASVSLSIAGTATALRAMSDDTGTVTNSETGTGWGKVSGATWKLTQPNSSFRLPPDFIEISAPQQDQKLGLTTGDSGAWRFIPAANRDPALPRVLLIGDSICNGYRGMVSRDLAGKAAVDVWLTPTAENDPGLPGDLEKVLKQGPYAVVHFNIGLHGWPKGRIPDGQYEPLMRKYVEVLRQHATGAKLIWASSTPITVKGRPAELDATDNPTITTRNASAAAIMTESGITVNDLYSLIVEKRADLAAGDRFHWKPPAYSLMARQIVERIAKDLPGKP